MRDGYGVMLLYLLIYCNRDAMAEQRAAASQANTSHQHQKLCQLERVHAHGRRSSARWHWLGV
jgi:hypothetical protein